MALRRDIVTVYSAGLIQGIAGVTFPAASVVLTSPQAYGLSSAEYGGLFIPQAFMAILASLSGIGLRHRLGAQCIYRLGLSANLLAVTLLVMSRFFMDNHALAYAILLIATAGIGIGFGFTVPVLNTFAAAFFPEKADRAVLGLNALLGLGTALAPVFVALFVGLGIWWGLPVLVGLLIFGLLLLGLGETPPAGDSSGVNSARPGKFPARFWVFALFALLYGICETVNGNWTSLYMTQRFGASATMASLALTLFWSLLTAGRILFATMEKWFPGYLVGRILPLVVTAAFILSACVPKTNPLLGFFSFALAGFGCSALLPLAISFGQKELATVSTAVAGGLIAFYQIGYGLAAFGVGPLQTWVGLNLSTVYGGTAVIALALSALSFFVTRKSTMSVVLDRP